MIKIKTIYPTEKRELNFEQIRHLRFLLQPYWFPFDEDGEDWQNIGYFSNMICAYRDCTGVEPVFHGYCGSFRSDDADDSFDFFYDGIPAVDFYCVPNGFKTAQKRTKVNLSSISNIVIDIDSHDSTLSYDELQNYIKAFVPKLLDNLLVIPNFISYTGRGVHFWYCFPAVAAATYLESMESIAAGLVGHFTEVLDNLGELELSVDAGASKKLSGLFRIPYSYNSKSKTWGSGELLSNKRHDINYILSILKQAGYISIEYKNSPLQSAIAWAKTDKSEKKKSKPKSKKKPKTPKYRHGKKQKDAGLYANCFEYRKKYIEHLIETRDNLHGCRNKLLFALFMCVYNLYPLEDAENYIRDVNSHLPEPLRDSEIDALIKGVYKNNYRYRFKNEEFLQLVDSTPAEVRWFNNNKVKKQKANAKKQIKIDRDSRIWELHENGLSVADIAKEMDCCRNTVYKVLAQIPF